MCYVPRYSYSYTVSRLRLEPSLWHRNLYDNGKWKTTIVYHQRPSKLQQLESLPTDLYISRSGKYVIPLNTSTALKQLGLTVIVSDSISAVAKGH